MATTMRTPLMIDLMTDCKEHEARLARNALFSPDVNGEADEVNSPGRPLRHPRRSEDLVRAY